MDFHQCKKMFIAYAKSYLTGNEIFDRNIELKISHTLRVCSFAAMISEQEKYSVFDETTLMYAALLHDASRFEQLKLFHTFRDSERFDHGNKAAEMLENNLFGMKIVGKTEFACIVNAVRLHNKRVIPSDSFNAVKALRDADKLDIFSVVLDELDNPSNPDVLYNLSPEKRFSERVWQAVSMQTSPRHCDLETIDDFVLAKLAWVYDFNTNAAKNIFRNSGYLPRLRKHLEHNKLSDEAFDKVYKFLQETK